MSELFGWLKINLIYRIPMGFRKMVRLESFFCPRASVKGLLEAILQNTIIILFSFLITGILCGKRQLAVVGLESFIFVAALCPRSFGEWLLEAILQST